MPLTGRAVYCRKALVEEAKAIDLALLREKGFFKRGSGIVWTSSWTSRGESSGKVSYWREDYLGEPLLLWFSYNSRKPGAEWCAMKYYVEIVSTRCHFGGLRHWLICPLAINGRECGRRCRCLYLAGISGYFGCRECQRLTYESRRNHRDTFWDVFGKHREYVKNVEKKFKNPRGRKAKARRARRLAIATNGMTYGLAALPYPF